MAFRCGFFNSKNGDRLYNAEEMNNPYIKIVSNGVFGDAESSVDLQVQANSGLNIKVKEGRGIFAGKWAWLDADMELVVPTAHISYSRIDSVIVRIDSTEEVRAGSIIYKNGEPSANPTAPELINTADVKEYRLANIAVAPNATTITQANITDTRPTSECGFIHNLLWDSDISATYAQWQAQFTEWFDQVKATLATQTILTSFTGRFTAVADDTKNITIPISNYNQALDTLQVYVSGMLLKSPEDYIINNDGTITLTLGVNTGTIVDFIVYKSVDGSQAETVVRQVELLIAAAPTAINENLNGRPKVLVGRLGDVYESFNNAPHGLITMSSTAGAANAPTSDANYLFIGHTIMQGGGWLIAIAPDGTLYSNSLIAGTWSGWKQNGGGGDEPQSTPLWTGEARLESSSEEVVPSKPLSECRNGWILYLYTYSYGTWQSVQIYKKGPLGANWDGSQSLTPALFTNNSNQDAMTTKVLTIFNNKIQGHALNSQRLREDTALMKIYEF